MGHGGNHTYKDCINDLYSKVDKNVFKNRLLHLKTRKGEEDIAEEIKRFCEDKDVRVLETVEDIVHHSENHQIHSAGYFKDILKAYSDSEIQKQKYSFWLEDDELLQTDSITLESALVESVKFLEENPNQLCVRFNRAKEFGEPMDAGSNSKHEYLFENENIFTQAINYSEWGPTFTFQPNINRTKQIFLAWQEAQKYLDNLGDWHCEVVSGSILRQVTNIEKETAFSFFNTNKVFSKTIG
tara:strand:+ start:103 stop:825 length:723 start_codon:yes stop_codon:yes gene_type:complete